MRRSSFCLSFTVSWLQFFLINKGAPLLLLLKRELSFIAFGWLELLIRTPNKKGAKVLQQPPTHASESFVLQAVV